MPLTRKKWAARGRQGTNSEISGRQPFALGSFLSAAASSSARLAAWACDGSLSATVQVASGCPKAPGDRPAVEGGHRMRTHPRMRRAERSPSVGGRERGSRSNSNSSSSSNVSGTRIMKQRFGFSHSADRRVRGAVPGCLFLALRSLAGCLKEFPSESCVLALAHLDTLSSQDLPLIITGRVLLSLLLTWVRIRLLHCGTRLQQSH